ANLLQSVMPPACLRTAQMVETAPRRTARTRHRLRQGPRCHTAGNTAGPAWSWHRPPAAATRAEATPSPLAVCREVMTLGLALWLVRHPHPPPSLHSVPPPRCSRNIEIRIPLPHSDGCAKLPPDLGRTKLL